MLPEEITRPSAEYASTDATEFPPLSDEFFQRAAPAAPPRKKRKPLQLAAGVMAAVVVVNAFVGLPLAQSKAPAESPIAEATDPPIVETAPPTPPIEMEVLEPYENPGDTCIITVSLWKGCAPFVYQKLCQAGLQPSDGSCRFKVLAGRDRACGIWRTNRRTVPGVLAGVGRPLPALPWPSRWTAPAAPATPAPEPPGTECPAAP